MILSNTTRTTIQPYANTKPTATPTTPNPPKLTAFNTPELSVLVEGGAALVLDEEEELVVVMVVEVVDEIGAEIDGEGCVGKVVCAKKPFVLVDV